MRILIFVVKPFPKQSIKQLFVTFLPESRAHYLRSLFLLKWVEFKLPLPAQLCEGGLKLGAEGCSYVVREVVEFRNFDTLYETSVVICNNSLNRLSNIQCGK